MSLVSLNSVLTPSSPDNSSPKASINKISSFVKKVFQILNVIVCFPWRYFGSKSWSIPGFIFRTPIVLFKRMVGIKSDKTLIEQIFSTGYQHQPEILSAEETKQYIRCATVATAAHNLTPKWRKSIGIFGFDILSPQKLIREDQKVHVLENIDANQDRFFDKKSGLKAIVAGNDDEVIISFGALGGPSIEINDVKEREILEKKIWKNVVHANHAGLIPDIYSEANALFLAIKNHPQIINKKIKLVGHCMGGSLAAYIGLKNRVKVVSFNTLSHGAGIQQQIGKTALSNADRFITHISIENDFFSDFKVFSFFDRCFSLMGFRTPGNFGKHYRIPAADEYTKFDKFKDRQDAIHNFVMGSMMEHIGKSNRTIPQDLKSAYTNMDQFQIMNSGVITRN